MSNLERRVKIRDSLSDSIYLIRSRLHIDYENWSGYLPIPNDRLRYSLADT